jgi:outer membrane protein assembly factor BamE (lipoprotein component of BamABCDE complex)
MNATKQIDRIALAAIFSTIVAIPLLATSSNAHAARAEPAASVVMPDGTQRRFYTTGPAGTLTYREVISVEGKLLARTQVLTDDNFARIRPGMLASEVLASIGPPYAKSRFESTKTTAWDYHFNDVWNYESEFSVIVGDDDVVVSTFKVRNGQ